MSDFFLGKYVTPSFIDTLAAITSDPGDLWLLCHGIQANFYCTAHKVWLSGTEVGAICLPLLHIFIRILIQRYSLKYSILIKFHYQQTFKLAWSCVIINIQVWPGGGSEDSFSKEQKARLANLRSACQFYRYWTAKLLSQISELGTCAILAAQLWSQ